ncbi:Uncharacterised protein [Mycobacteroides abscessus subsp. abscessus]|nr:Uncharacterised protein [Mycobacteroides abscessus subsp. abscessus]
MPGLDGRALGRPVPRARLLGRDRRVGHELDVGAHDALAVGGQHHGAIHLGQFA